MGISRQTQKHVLAGQTVATIAEQDFVLRLRVPERHARFLKAGNTSPARNALRISSASGMSGRGQLPPALDWHIDRSSRILADARVINSKSGENE
jgi:hypothetical protein